MTYSFHYRKAVYADGSFQISSRLADKFAARLVHIESGSAVTDFAGSRKACLAEAAARVEQICKTRSFRDMAHKRPFPTPDQYRVEVVKFVEIDNAEYVHLWNLSRSVRNGDHRKVGESLSTFFANLAARAKLDEILEAEAAASGRESVRDDAWSIR